MTMKTFSTEVNKRIKDAWDKSNINRAPPPQLGKETGDGFFGTFSF